MFWLLIGGSLFLIGAIYNLIQGEITEAIGGIVIAILMFGTSSLFFLEKKKSEAFLEWLINNRFEIETSEAYFNGISISPDTEVTQFQASISFLLVSVKSPSRYYVRGYHFTPIISLVYSLISFIFGWWGIPWGPIYTIQVIFNNLKGGKKITVHSLLSSIQSSPVFTGQTSPVNRNIV